MAVYKDYEGYGLCMACEHFSITKAKRDIKGCNDCKWLLFGNKDKWLPKVRRPLKSKESRKPIVNSGYITALQKTVEEWFFESAGVVPGKKIVNKLRSRLKSVKAPTCT